MNEQDVLEIDRFFEELQAHIVLVGGKKIPIGELELMSVRSLCEKVWPNGIKLKLDNCRFLTSHFLGEK